MGSLAAGLSAAASLLSQKGGSVPPEQASSSLAAVLPTLVDHLTPTAQLAQGEMLEGLLGSVLGKLGT